MRIEISYMLISICKIYINLYKKSFFLVFHMSLPLKIIMFEVRSYIKCEHLFQ